MKSKLTYIFFLFLGYFFYGKNIPSTFDPKLKIDQDTITQVHFDKNFKERYKDGKFIYEFKTQEKNAWDRFLEWLNRLLNGSSKSNNPNALNGIDLVIRIAAFLLIIFVIYLIVKALLNKEGNWIFGKNSQTKIIDYEDVENNIHIADFRNLILNAEKQDNYRLASRYYYLWLLKKMTDANIIEWIPEKTNSDYSYEITNETLKEKFNYLSYLYNYIWYGEFDITNEIYQKTKQDFENTLSIIR